LFVCFSIINTLPNESLFFGQVLCYLNQASSLFCSGYFGDRVTLFAQACLDHHPPILCSLLSLVWQVQTTMLSFFLLRWGLFQSFCLGWPGTAILISASHVAWHIPLLPAISWDGVSRTFCWVGLKLWSNLDLPGSKDYRHELPVPGSKVSLDGCIPVAISIATTLAWFRIEVVNWHGRSKQILAGT
jgi:hypothetical protein